MHVRGYIKINTFFHIFVSNSIENNSKEFYFNVYWLYINKQYSMGARRCNYRHRTLAAPPPRKRNKKMCNVIKYSKRILLYEMFTFFKF